MNLRNSTDRYGSLSIGLHWLMLLLFVAVYGCIELRGYFLIGLHAAAALFHHYFIHDNTLRRMLPSRN